MDINTYSSCAKRSEYKVSWRKAASAGLAVTLMAGPAYAFQIDTDNPDMKVNWDNTVKYSAAWRTKNPSSTLTADPNQNDGDANFNKGLISNRVDWFTEFDATYKNFGLRLSGAAWYDDVYNRSNDHPNDGTANQFSVPYNQFMGSTRDLHGRKGELLDAFVFGKFDVADMPALVRVGKHSLVWGETLFFGMNGIAGGMMPIDAVKLSSVPNTQFKEAIRPVQQISGQIQFTPNVTLGAYAQLRWEPNRIPGVGSYFSAGDSLPNGEQILMGLPTPPFLTADMPHVNDLKAKNSGQGGLQLRIRHDETDYGLYLIRFHNKDPQLVPNIGLRPVIFVPGPGCVVPGSIPTGPASCALPGLPTSYQLAYHEGITSLGGSVSRTFGDANIAAEVSFRDNQDLASSTGAVDTSALTGGAPTNNSNNPAYAIGRTAHFNLSTLWSVPSTPLFKEASFLGEIAWNRVLSITKNAAAVDPNATREAWALRMIFEPTYRQVAPGFDLSVPIGVGYAPKGSRSMVFGASSMPNDGGGDVTIGLNGTYLESWRLSLAYTHYFGTEKTFVDAASKLTYQQFLKDRDFIAFSVRRTF